MFGGSTTQSTTDNKISSFKVQSSVKGGVLPLVYGRNRVKGNLLWFSDFSAVYTPNQQQAGKGMGGGGDSGGSYEYFGSYMLGLCAGPITSVLYATANNIVYEPDKSGLVYMYGGFGSQDPWGYLTTSHPDDAFGYPGIAYGAGCGLSLGSNASLPNWNFEIVGLCPYSWSYDGYSAFPADIVYDFLCDPYHGAYWPRERLDDLSWLGVSTYRGYCYDNGFWASPAYESQRSAAEMVTEIADLTNSALVFTQGKLKIIPYGDESSTYYVAPSAPLFDLNDDDYLDKGQPVKFSRVNQSDIYNQMTYEFLDGGGPAGLRFYADTITVQDDASIALWGARPADVKQAHIYTNKLAPQRAAQLALQRQLNVRNTYEIQLGWKYIVLDPMDIVTLTDVKLGLDRQWARVKEISEDEDGKLTVTLEEYLQGTGAAAKYDFQNTNGYWADYRIDCGNPNAPVIFEPPWLLTQDLEIWLAVSGGINWGGCDVYVSTDDKSYKKFGSIIGRARQGTLSAPLPAGPAVDTVHTLAVDLAMSISTLSGGTQQDAKLLNTLCYCGGELLAYQGATLTAVNSYNLTWLVRGAYGSPISSHAAGSQFVRLDSLVSKFPFDAGYIGQTLYFKFVGRNLYQEAIQDLSQVRAYAYKVQGSALKATPGDVTGLNTNYIGGIARIYWSKVEDFRPTLDYEVRMGASWSNSKSLGRTPLTEFPYQGDGTYWVAAHYRHPNGVEIYSASPSSIAISGGMLPRNVLATYDEKALNWLGTLVGLDRSGSNLMFTPGAITDHNGDHVLDHNSRPVTDGTTADFGYYTIPVGHKVDIGYESQCNVMLNYVLGAISQSQDILLEPDILLDPDILQTALCKYAGAQPQINLAMNDGVWIGWQNFVPGTYSARHFDFRFAMSSNDSSVASLLEGFSFTVDVPDREDTGTNVSLLAAGSTITFATPFHAPPHVQITRLNMQAGDILVFDQANVTTTGFPVRITNSGIGVVRSINWRAKGY